MTTVAFFNQQVTTLDFIIGNLIQIWLIVKLLLVVFQFLLFVFGVEKKWHNNTAPFCYLVSKNKSGNSTGPFFFILDIWILDMSKCWVLTKSIINYENPVVWIVNFKTWYWLMFSKMCQNYLLLSNLVVISKEF